MANYIFNLKTTIRFSFVLCVILSSLVARGQTYVTSPMTGTPAPGGYYNDSGILLNPGFSFTAASGSSLHLYIQSGCIPLGTAPSANQNYTLTSTPHIAGITTFAGRNACELMQTVQYFDGLGRPLQAVIVKGNPVATKDVIQPTTYDQFGRETINYLPYTTATGNPGSYRSDALTGTSGYSNSGQKVFYSQTGQNYTAISTPFAVTGLEPSSLNRIVEQGAAGDDWQFTGTGDANSAFHTVKTAYVANNATALTDTANSRVVALYTVTTNGDQSRTLNRTGNNAAYNAGQLYVTVSKNENWKSGRGGTVEQYKDKEGHLVLSRTFNYVPGSPQGTLQILSTYYVYDDLGNLAFVLPPGSNADATTGIPGINVLNNLCYQYRYDERNRLTQKKLPGKGWEFMVYNTLNQMVLSQDANQRNQAPQQWTFAKYDAMGRVIMTGLLNYGATADSDPNSPDRTNLFYQQALYKNTSHPKWEARNNSTSTGYDNSSDPIGTSFVYLTINYYDDYVFPGLPTAFVAPAGISAQSTGFLTGTKKAVLNNPADMLWSVNYYDGLDRNIKGYQQHYLGGAVSANNYDETSSTYNFNNEITTSTRLHHTVPASGNVALKITNWYNYDHLGRKTSSWEQIQNSGQAADTRTLLVKLDYNEIGQLWKKHLHSTDSVTFKQDIVYSYNERGWLTQGGSAYFTEQLQYNTGTNKQYNGNIAYQNWSANGGATKTYTYNYDLLNRLTGANSTDNYNENNITYDVMGNIQTLNRYAGNLSAPTDLLAYSYLSGTNATNQLQTITDNSTDNTNVKAGGPNTYVYDLNGNVTTDASRLGGIVNISYNLLNRPKAITGAKAITYYYDIGGRKLRRQSSVTGNTDYIGDLQYDGTTTETLSFIRTEEGRALPDGPQHYNYEYFLTDHLGNSRASFDSKTGITNPVQVDDYYAFGLEINRNPPVPALKNEYLYNKKEIQEELGQYDYGARFYDPAIARWGVMDRLAEDYSSMTPYQYAALNPISNIDLNGDTIKINYHNHDILYENGKLYNLDGTEYKGDGTRLNKDGTVKRYNGFLGATVEALASLKKSKAGKDEIDELSASANVFIIADARYNPQHPGGDAFYRSNPRGAYAAEMQSQGNPYFQFGGSGGTIYFDPFNENGSGDVPEVGGDVAFHPDTDLGHELFHAVDANRGVLDDREIDGLVVSEWRASYYENIIRNQLNYKYRTQYNIGLPPNLLDVNGNPIPVYAPLPVPPYFVR